MRSPRRAIARTIGALVAPALIARACPAQAPTDLILHNAALTTQDDAHPHATALAVVGERIVAVGSDADILALRAPGTRVIDAGARRVIPGLNDSHLHAVRAGRFYTLELRWEGVPTLARALEMVREQAQRTPEGQWVRIVGGWSPHQFVERRMPTVAGLNEAAPDTPVFVLFLYSQAFINRAGVEALALTPQSTPPAGGRYEFVDGGAILHAEPNPTILYATVSSLPALSPEDQRVSTAHFFRELNRLGLTSAIDPGGGGHAFPDDYAATFALAREPAFPIRLSNYLFAQKPGEELDAYTQWTTRERLGLDRAVARLNGLVTEGAGENLVWSAGDFENFMAPRPELGERMEGELAAVVRLLAAHDWPIRIHATYDESISRILDIFEPIFRETSYDARWCIDHAETISPENISRIKRLGGGIAVQNRMAFAGELFVERYGRDAARRAPPIRAMLDAGLPVGAGTDATRVSSYNPWVSLHWMTTGKTAGGLQLAAPDNLLTRAEALRLYTLGSAWLTDEEQEKGRLAPGQLADFAVLSEDYFAVREDQIPHIESVLTVVGGDVVYAAEPFAAFAPPPLDPISPAWSPVARFGPGGRPLSP